MKNTITSKTRSLLLLLFVVWMALAHSASAQVTIEAVDYAYDAAGNRIIRKLRSSLYRKEAQEIIETALDSTIEIHLYPNPVSSEINIRITKFKDTTWTAQLVDLKGQQKFIKTYTKTEATENLSELATGMYVLYIEIRKKHYTYKIIKE